MKRLFLLTLLGLLPLSGVSAETFKERQLAQAIASARTPQAKGLAIAKMADYRDSGWGDSEAKMKMILRNRQGRSSRRNVRVRTLEVFGDGDKGMSIFDTPRDVKGTVVLTWSHALKPDHQWIYLPALKRVKRISSRNKSGPFMGSEFAYEDIASQEVKKYTYRYLRNEYLRNESNNWINCYVVERKPTYRYSGYTRQVSWIDKQHFNSQKIVFYDRKNARLKTLIFKNYRQYLGKYWRAHKMFMQNHQTGKSTK
ncbi:MAG TPA: outer membrane lipoprotein-sorting protein, partial [Thioploca sp.]|nr:outer membrane lipoprotein-sorting protein [Thioploca sp.]